MDPAVAYQPFDANADGLVLGEGAGFLVLERWEHAVERGATILGEFSGAGSAMGDGEQWRPAWTAETICRAARQAMGDARPDFVVASGMGTVAEDSTEGAALAALVGSRTPVTALKSQTGYMGAGTAAAELGLGLLCARQGFVPAIARHTRAGQDGVLDLVAGPPRKLAGSQPLGLFISCSWGGAVAALAARASGPVAPGCAPNS
jgi:3-oxoacyl-[acyl-carrier-protein] synthase II